VEAREPHSKLRRIAAKYLNSPETYLQNKQRIHFRPAMSGYPSEYSGPQVKEYSQFRLQR
jgi:hypothetical protein